MATSVLSRLSRKANKPKGTLAAVIAAGVLIGLFALFCLFLQGPRVCEGTVIFGVDIGGLQEEQAADVLRTQFEKSLAVAFESRGITVQRTLKAAGLIPDFEAITKQVCSYLWWVKGPCVWEFKGNVDSDSFDSFVNHINGQLPHAQNARIVSELDEVRIEPATEGYEVDNQALSLVLQDLFVNYESKVIVPLIQRPPEVATEDVENMGINRLVSSYTTYFVEDGARSHNIRLAAEKIHGTVLAPGAELSFNGVVGSRSAENGYKEANVYFESRVERGFGGGVCQVSTTLYNAALLSNLEIVERHCHSMTVDYVPLGRDASVVYELLDLVFLNNTQNHVLVTAECGVGFLTFRVFGDAPEQDVQIEIIVLSETEFETETVDDPSLAEGVSEVSAGKLGYRVATYKNVRYPNDPEREPIRTFLGYSNYKPMKQVIREGIEQ